MDIRKFEVHLKKINTFKQNIDLSGEDISPLELELLKNYVKQLYESIALEEEVLEFEAKSESKKKKKKKKDLDIIENEIIEESDIKEEEETIVEEELQEEEIVEEVAQKEFDEVLIAIFERSSSSDLSEKLSASPIKDIKKAIGINDRIFTINELFGGDKEVFNDSIDKLNAFETFDQAKEYLLNNIAEKYNWSKTDNVKKAKRFVKILTRRYQ